MNNQQTELDNKVKNNSEKIRILMNEVRDKIEDYQCTSPTYEKYLIKKKIKSFWLRSIFNIEIKNDNVII